MGDKEEDHSDMVMSTAHHQPTGTPSSIESTPDRDHPEAEADAAPAPNEEPAQPQKRKGGRKPIYATSEERKQRNRQAQAAFRERRTEYIKQLEATIKQNEETLSTLQQSHRTAADECLMLRYKNSLLERILLEKGIDVQSELQMKTGSPVLGPGFMHPLQQPQLQRTALRQQARRSFLPKLAPGQSNSDVNLSPLAHPTPSSHASSPSQLSIQSPALPQFQQRPHHRSTQSSTYPSGASAFYPSPFQKHYDQLDQEYETAEQYQYDIYQQQQAPFPAATSHPGRFDDPMLEADPFGLSASMNYP